MYIHSVIVSYQVDMTPGMHTTLHYITLHYTTLHYITLHYTTLHYTTLHYTTLHYTTLHYTTLHSSIVALPLTDFLSLFSNISTYVKIFFITFFSFFSDSHLLSLFSSSLFSFLTLTFFFYFIFSYHIRFSLNFLRHLV